MRILTIVHNHSSNHPGGTEYIAEALHAAYGARDDVEASWLLAAQDPGLSAGLAGTTVSALPGYDDVYLFRHGNFDPIMQTRDSLEPFLFDVSWLLDELRPTHIHIHHLNHWGVELLGFLRRKLPDVKIILTLHDYYFICANDGLLQDEKGRPCAHMRGDICRCIPALPVAQAQAKRLNVLQHLTMVDRIVAPSRFLMEQFINWGVPKQQITLINHGWPVTVPDVSSQPDPHRFALIGNLRPSKGTLLAMRAFNMACERSALPLELDIWGDALYQPDTVQEEIKALARESKGAIRLHGRYEQLDVSRAMDRAAWVLVPSLWWENAPLVIQEAFAAGRPVLCSNIGGMAEAVRDGKDGRHVPVGDLSAWADTLADCGGNAPLWGKLHKGIKPRKTVAQMADDYISLLAVKARKAA